MRRLLGLVSLTVPCLVGLHSAFGQPKDDGYRGIWYYNQPSKDEYAYKYSGGFATYPQQMLPFAYYSKAANKTFFCYGGRTKESNVLLHMVSYYDHATGKVPRPTILLNKHTSDAHDNPTIMLDDAGTVWIFSAAHGTSRPAFIHRSKKPYSVDEFEQVMKTNFSYAQPWWLPGEGFLLMHTRYDADRGLGIAGIRGLHWMSSRDGAHWDEPHPLANIEMGDYQVSGRCGTRLATTFDYHPKPLGLNARSNIYYLESNDHGKTWRTVSGEPVTPPLTEPKNPALVLDSRAENQLVYIKDLNFDADGRPVILFLTSKGYASGPANGLRQWQTIRWTGKEWTRRPFTTSDHNYDHGSLYIESDGTWRVIATTDPGPQPWTTGGEIVMWTSRDRGATWTKVKQLTHDSRFNHTYPRRPVNAHPDFYAFWADGNPLKQSDSSLYFTNKDGDHVWRLPSKMEGEFETPEIAW